ncbi:MAG: hypothetical protein U0075_01690 [Thermomicrobiales bacterium]
MQRGRAAQLGPPSCGTAGKVCTMLAGCCEGLTCVTSAINTNYGVCVSGGDGGTVASGTSLVSPFSESAQATGTVDSPTSSTSTTTSTGTTTTGTSTTTTTDPKAERQAKLQERRSRRSTRRNKIQSRRNTKATSRKTRREDANKAEVLAAGPELEFDYFVKEPTGSGPQEPYEELLVTNVSDFSAILSSVKLIGDKSSGTSLSGKSVTSGDSFGLVSGLLNGDKLSSDQFWWAQDDVCQNVPDPASRGWIVKAAFSGEAENRTYTILCDGSVNGVPLTTDDGTSNNRKKRKRKQQAAARRKKRKQNKKDHSNR